MLKFVFGSFRARKELRVPKGVHIFQESELEGAVGGGTPVHEMLNPMNVRPDWLQNTTYGGGAGDGQFSRYTQMFPTAQWQSGVTWGEPNDDIMQATRYNY